MLAQEYLRKLKIATHDWSKYFQDFNSIENIWLFMVKKLRKKIFQHNQSK